jgi:hypothetical protein
MITAPAAPASRALGVRSADAASRDANIAMPPLSVAPAKQYTHHERTRVRICTRYQAATETSATAVAAETIGIHGIGVEPANRWIGQMVNYTELAQRGYRHVCGADG